ncbi:restriction endonuclease subunit S [Haemophilus haemoglobinophilus]|nr:restriction endonuclease subunit S [Canicola haemoglobinophilus]
MPENWVWVRLNQLGEIVGGGTPKTDNDANWVNGKIAWITPADMKNVKGKYISKGERYITLEGLNSSSTKMLSKSSIVYSSRAPIGYIAITNDALCTNQGFKSIDLYNKSVVDYLYYGLIYFTPLIQSRASGTTFKEISGTEFGKIIIPLPPLSEQKRIVAKIEELLPFIEQYAKKEQELTALHQAFPEQLKKSILQAAIQGKLTEQNPNDEPAIELVKRIQAEKERLILEKKIKKPKQRSEIIVRDNSHYEIVDGVERCIDDEIPFEIPENWCWVRLSNVFEIHTGVTYGKSDQLINEGARIIRGGNIVNSQINLFDNDIWIKSEKVKPTQWIKIGDLLTPSVTSLENVGKFALIESNIPNIAIGGFVFGLRSYIYNQDYIKYLFFLMSSEFVKKQMQERTNKSGQAFYNLGKSKFEDVLLIIPPFSEQQRIVSKIEKLFFSLESLTK